MNAPIQSSNESARPTAGILPQQPDLFELDVPIGFFYGTDNPRYLRVLAALIWRLLMREEVDRVAGCSNGPQLVKEIRKAGLAVPCKRLNFRDRDGRRCRPGQYCLTDNDRKLIREWLERTPQVRHHFQESH